MPQQLENVAVVNRVIERQSHSAADEIVARSVRFFDTRVLVEGLDLQHVRAEGNVPEPRKQFHRRDENRAATFHVVLQRRLLRRVQRVGRQRVVIQPPDHHAEGSQIIRAGRPAVAHFPDFITQSGLIKRVRVVGDRNFRRAELGVGRVGVHQQRRLRRHGDKAEPSAVVVVRRYVARLVRRNDEKLVSRFGQKIVQLHLVRGLQN